MTRVHLIFCLLPLLLVTACASYYEKTHEALQAMRGGKYDAALKSLDESSLSKSGLLYNLEKGTILHYAGRYQESNVVLENADRIQEELYTTSISAVAASFLTSDNVLSYEGEDFEKVLINYYMAMNYLMMDSTEDALVECRRIIEKLNLINDRYANDKKNTYADDPAIHYLTGILFESEGETNDALVAYRKAYQSWELFTRDYGLPVPPSLVRDYYRLAKRKGFAEDMEKLETDHPDAVKAVVPLGKDQGEVVLIFEAGSVPAKKEESITTPVPANGYILRVAVPAYPPLPVDNREAVLRDSAITVASEAISDIGAIAVRNLSDRMGRIMAKTIARAVAKYLAVQAANEIGKSDKKDSKGRKQSSDDGPTLLGAVMNIFTAATESADTRSWLSLPRSVHVIRAAFPAGTHDLTLDLRRNGRSDGAVAFPGVKVDAGKVTFLKYRDFE